MFKLETKDLLLRDICEEDLKKHYTWLTHDTEWWNWDASYWQYQNLSEQQLTIEIPKLMDSMRSFLQMVSQKKPDDVRYSFQIELKQTGEYIGWISCYCIDENFVTTDDDALYAFGIDIPEKKYRSKGLGFQAFSAAIEYYKAHGIDEVYTQTWSGNTPMIRLAQKIGFKLVDVKKDAREHNGKEFDALTFKI